MKLVLTSAVAAITIGLGALMLTASPSAEKAASASSNAASVPVRITENEIINHPTEIVELFTSQGCSSCPPADRFLASLADSPTTLALSFNVTYWDYLGWKDRFGQRDFTLRQKQYAKALGIGNVYTPQLVLNGGAHSNQFSRNQVKQAALPSDRPLIDLLFEGHSIRATGPANVNLEDFDLTMITYNPGLQETHVKRGENRNRTLENYNVVQDVYPLSADKNYSYDMSEHSKGMAYVLMASDPKSAEIISVTQILPK